jgi:hypothetical protein
VTQFFVSLLLLASLLYVKTTYKKGELISLKRTHILMLQVSALNITHPYQHMAEHLGYVSFLILFLKLKTIQSLIF